MPVVIRDLIPPPRKISFGTGELEIRGLRLDEVVQLLVKYRESIVPFFSGDKIEFDAMLASVPTMAVEIIALAADAVGQEEDILKIPASDLIDVLLSVWETSVPNVRKLAEALGRAVKDVTPQSKLLTSTQPQP